jgi:hypothetical protein
MIETTCTRCERIFRPSREDFRAGVCRLCPACRDGPPAQGSRSHAGRSQAFTGPKNAPNVSSGPDRQGETAA